MPSWITQSGTMAEFAAERERQQDRTETVRAALELAGLPVDAWTRDALSDLAAEIERFLVNRATAQES